MTLYWTKSSKIIFDLNQWWQFTRNWLAWNLKEHSSYGANTCSPWKYLFYLFLKSIVIFQRFWISKFLSFYKDNIFEKRSENHSLPRILCIVAMHIHFNFKQALIKNLIFISLVFLTFSIGIGFQQEAR